MQNLMVHWDLHRRNHHQSQRKLSHLVALHFVHCRHSPGQPGMGLAGLLAVVVATEGRGLVTLMTVIVAYITSKHYRYFCKILFKKKR